MVDPVHFTSKLKLGEGAEAEIIFHATIDDGWHVYSTELGDDGPIEATFNVEKMEGAELVGKLTPVGKVIKKMDKLFNMELKYFEKEATFIQKIRFTKPQYDIDCYLEYGACSDASCLPPSEVVLKEKGPSCVPSVASDLRSSATGSGTVSATGSGTVSSGADDKPSGASEQEDTIYAGSDPQPPILGGSETDLGTGQTIAALALADGLCGWSVGCLHALHLADHPHDGEFLPETFEG